MNVDSVWAIMQDSSVTDSDIVIGIIDTGVDTTHADLHGRQFFNMLEVNGLPGVDDDNNGFIDDKSGWDFVNNDNHPADDNSHGTHCAGIAVGAHNQIGIAGVSKGAKYMPIKGLESSGGSAASVLAQGVVYAANNGADILSMSFGGYGRSLALENALAYAYAFSLPVGAPTADGPHRCTLERTLLFWRHKLHSRMQVGMDTVFGFQTMILTAQRTPITPMSLITRSTLPVLTLFRPFPVGDMRPSVVRPWPALQWLEVRRCTWLLGPTTARKSFSSTTSCPGTIFKARSRKTRVDSFQVWT
jgi:hypothetical protein